VTHLGFRVWGTTGFRGWVGWVMLALRTFPELVGRSVQNFVEIGPAVFLGMESLEVHFLTIFAAFASDFRKESKITPSNFI